MNMKKIKNFSIFLFLFVGIFIFSKVLALKNPAALYCYKLGYDYQIKTDEKGNQYGICVFPNKKSCVAWKFLWGECGKEYSFCTKKGYEMKTIKDRKKCAHLLSPKCAVCILPDNREIEVTKLMQLELKEGVCGDGKCVLGENYKNCPKDCPSGGADGYCDKVKDGICDPDCIKKEDPDCQKVAVCSNGKCEKGENYKNCPQDCPSGGKDNYCDRAIDGICDPDCLANEDLDCLSPKERKPKIMVFLKIGAIILGILIFVLLFVILVLYRKRKQKNKT